MRTSPPPARRRLGPRLAFVCTSTLAVAFACAAYLWPAPAPVRTAPPDTAPAAAAAPSRPAPEAAPPPVEPPPERTEAPPPAPPAEPPTFAQCVEQLVDLGRRTARLAQDDEIDAAQTSDLEARRLLGRLLQWFPDAGERGLAQLAGMVEPSDDPRDPARRIVLRVVIAAELARRHEAAVANDDHGRIDPLVEALLTVMPQSAGATEVGGTLLGDRPYLRAAHEPAVFELLRLAGEGAFPRAVAIELLSTLWTNLQRTGERSSDELSRLALLLLGDSDTGKRVVACRQLLGDPRFRPLALLWLREHGDAQIAAEVAGLCAHDLPPDAALQVLRELGPLLRRAPGAYMVLGARAPELVADAYRDLLAANLQPDVRTDLVASAGLTGGDGARELVELALHDDPSPEVRLQAAFVLTATADPDAGERALQTLLDDPAIAGDATRLGAIVLALHNLEANAAVNQIDRLGRRLRTLPLDGASRRSLEELLARSLPGGQVSTGAGSATGSPR